MAWVTFLAASLAVLAYAGLFVAAGIWFRRAVWWGLAFVLIWENVVPYSADGAGRFTVVRLGVLLLGLAPGIDVEREAGSGGAAFVVLACDHVAGLAGRDLALRRADID